MSLLLDALKRAEQEKLARGPSDAVEEARPAAPPARSSVGANALELQPLSAQASAAGPGARIDAGVQGAQAVFQAKSAAAPVEPRGKGMIWATAGAFVVVAAAAAAYVWYSVKSLTPSQASFTPRPRPIGPAAALPVAPQSSPDAALAAAMGPRRPGPAEAPAVPPAVPKAPEPSRSAGEEPAKPAPAKLTPVEATVASLLREPAPEPAPVHLDRSRPEPRQVPADVAAGYQALREGKFATARRSYAAAIAQDPNNLDAHLGLATVEARAGNRAGAAAEYRRVLDLDSRNATALAGLAALAEFSRPEALEAQLRADLARFPGSYALHFTLGNLLSVQSRWREAQAEYYEAHRLDPGSGDVMYNLAVSLDHLGEKRAAAGFYARALETASSRSAQFDPAVAARRLAELR